MKAQICFIHEFTSLGFVSNKYCLLRARHMPLLSYADPSQNIVELIINLIKQITYEDTMADRFFFIVLSQSHVNNMRTEMTQTTCSSYGC